MIILAQLDNLCRGAVSKIFKLDDVDVDVVYGAPQKGKKGWRKRTVPEPPTIRWTSDDIAPVAGLEPYGRNADESPVTQQKRFRATRRERGYFADISWTNFSNDGLCAAIWIYKSSQNGM